MAGIRLEWAQFGDFDSFDVIRSDTSMANVADTDLPSQIASNLKTMYFVDTTVTLGNTYYYKVRAWRDDVGLVSSEVSIKAVTGDIYWEDVIALLHFDGNILDEKNKTWTASGNAAINSSYSKFGGSSIKLPARNDYVTCSTQNLISRYELFTIECWFYFDGTKDPSGQSCIFSQTTTGPGVGQTLYIGTGSSNALRFSRGANVGSAVSLNGTTIVTPNEWHHAALSFDGSKIYLFLDGNLEATANNTDGWYPSGSFRIGAYLNPSYTTYGMYGYIDEFRITKGVARYTSNFAKPTEPFTNY